jgi:hypothetical protein
MTMYGLLFTLLAFSSLGEFDFQPFGDVYLSLFNISGCREELRGLDRLEFAFGLYGTG